MISFIQNASHKKRHSKAFEAHFALNYLATLLTILSQLDTTTITSTVEHCPGCHSGEMFFRPISTWLMETFALAPESNHFATSLADDTQSRSHTQTHSHARNVLSAFSEQQKWMENDTKKGNIYKKTTRKQNKSKQLFFSPYFVRFFLLSCRALFKVKDAHTHTHISIRRISVLVLDKKKGPINHVPRHGIHLLPLAGWVLEGFACTLLSFFLYYLRLFETMCMTQTLLGRKRALPQTEWVKNIYSCLSFFFSNHRLETGAESGVFK